ncbi:polyisoprenoid-binding protein [Comamonas serinivorans]|uniref:Polyisoprenoid-binding protein n=1 Tax=Comamonas serinivorans TaxID=1082851 RepID=A0A1Y0EPV6_9BURK|nr:YceI family protein [Comamonas serinivorans]ARU05329.1 polyisoprenoid-binding protein [Comamonas serinivorans]
MITTRLSLAAVAAVAALGAAAPAMAASYAIDPSHTYVTFEIDHMGTTTNRVRFDKKEGTVEFDRAAKTGKVDISIDTASVNSGLAAFNKHLASADILDAEKFPKARFVADTFVFDGDKVSEVQGQLTIKDKTAPVTLKASKFNCYPSPMLQKREVCGGDFSATIDRSQWGVNYGSNFGVPKDVRLVVQIEAVKQ